jgi:hypothetical protein
MLIVLTVKIFICLAAEFFTNITHYNPPLKADRHPANQKMSNPLRKLKVRYHAHKSPELNVILKKLI